MDDNIKRVDNERTHQMYRDLNRVSKEIDYKNPTRLDKEWLKTALGAIFVTEPINDNEPFEVDRRVPCRRYSGEDFEVESLKITPRDTVSGGSYDIHFYALSPDQKMYYEFNGEIHQNNPNLRIKYSYIDEVPKTGIKKF